MNVLLNAVGAVDGLVHNQKITIICNKITIVKGLPTSEKIEIESISHIQPLTNIQIYKSTDSSIDSAKKMKFYIIGDKVQIINSQLKTLENCFVKWGDDMYAIFEKEDWSINGWVRLSGALQDV